MTVTDAVILCAGQGVRLRPMTETVPKVMLPVGDVPLLQHHVEHFSAQGIENFYFNLHHLPEVIQEHFGQGDRYGVRIVYSTETELRGTAGALDAFRDHLTTSFLVHYGDVYTRLTVSRMVQFHEQTGAVATLAVHPTQRFHDSDVVQVDANHRVTGLHVRPGNDRYGNLGNAACYILEPRVLAHVPSSGESDFVRDIFPRMLQAGEDIYAYHTDEPLHDMGTPERYEDLRQRLEHDYF